MELWHEYVELLKPAGHMIDRTWVPHSAQARAQLCRHLAINLAQGHFLYLQSDPDHPD